MNRLTRRRIPVLIAAVVAMSVVLAACGPPPPTPPTPPTPVVVQGQVVASVPATEVTFRSDQICAPPGSDVLIESDSNAGQLTRVILYDPAGPPPTNDIAVFIQNPGHVVLPAPSPCFKVIMAIYSATDYPVGSTLDYRIVAPGSAPPAVSPLTRTVTAPAGQISAFDQTPWICAPIGTTVTIDFTGNTAWTSAVLHSVGTALPPLPTANADPSGSMVLISTEPCFSAVVVIYMVPPAGATLDYTITW